MAKQVISVGLTANDGTGDSLRVGAQKINENFTELYTFLGNPSTGQLSVVSTVQAGAGITINNPSGNVTISNRIASTVALGGVKVDGTTITITEDGTIGLASSSLPSDLVNGDFVARLDQFGNLLLPAGTFGTSNIIATEDTNPVMLSFGGNPHGGPELAWLASNNPTLFFDENIVRNSIWIDSGGFSVSLNANAATPVNWNFSPTGNITLPENGDILDSMGNSVLSSIYNLPPATDTTLGGVKVDGNSISISEDGIISINNVDVTAVSSNNYFLGLAHPTLGYTQEHWLQLQAQEITSTFSLGAVAQWVKFTGNAGTLDAKHIVIAPDDANGWTMDLGGQTVNQTGLIPAGYTYISNSYITNMYGTNITVTGTVSATVITSPEPAGPIITSPTNINLTAETAVIVNTSPLRLASFTTEQRDLLAAVNGDLIYNTTANVIQGYQNGTWVNLG